MSVDKSWRESSKSVMLVPGPESYERGTLPGLIAQLNIESVRVSVLNRFSLVVVNSWSLSTSKDVQENATETGLDSATIASRDVDFSLRDAKANHTITRKLSPRLWSFSWLDGSDQLILVEARYPEPRDALDDKDAALMRLLFINLAQEHVLGAEVSKSDLPDSIPPSLDGQRSVGWLSLGLLVMLCACALLAGWLALFSVPAIGEEQLARQAETLRLQTVADQTVMQHLSKSLAAGDYGDLQDELTGFHALGYYPRGMVLNASKRVVAAVGDGNEASIGEAAPETLAASVRSVSLKRGDEELGRFIYPQRAAPAEIKSLLSLRALAAACALAAIGAAAFFLLFLRRR